MCVTEVFIHLDIFPLAVTNAKTKEVEMQVSIALLFTIAALSLVSVAVRGSPIFHVDDSALSVENLLARESKQGQARKRICGMSLYGCSRVTEAFMP